MAKQGAKNKRTAKAPVELLLSYALLKAIGLLLAELECLKVWG